MKTAQEAYQQALKNILVDTTPAMEAAEKAIDSAVALGYLGTVIGPFIPAMAEKAAIELEKIGYSATVQFSGKYREDNTPLCNININFKWLPAPSRESYI